ncbi:type II toxin-antitoxin system prevent-host-death family antitoxin [Aromatoleum toluvorans]|uniref:Antitoxin n=2 Tax=Aromatoleum toluvorans TaxID=92002 RepID=A0ABX1Q469_9RHOO|nr:type II toxin-antitoxin system prevent-host-death family antitoxin [Aromatoleum toluvorans]
MRQVQIAHAKAHLSALLELVEAGEEIVIARRGKAVARLVPEQRVLRSAADVLREVWAQGGLDIDSPAELPLDAHQIDLD